ncbi:hypothetical protein MEX01_39850 [Methylorubrum extorquens]|nr:hypothetical protein MEX01_39850 [Methylorubrum extorquens]
MQKAGGSRPADAPLRRYRAARWPMPSSGTSPNARAGCVRGSGAEHRSAHLRRMRIQAAERLKRGHERYKLAQPKNGLRLTKKIAGPKNIIELIARVPASL